MRDVLIITLAAAIVMGMFSLPVAAATPIQLPKVIPDKDSGLINQGQTQLPVTNPQGYVQTYNPPAPNPQVLVRDPQLPANNLQITGDCGKPAGAYPGFSAIDAQRTTHPVPIPYPNAQQAINPLPAGNPYWQTGMKPLQTGQFPQPGQSAPVPGQTGEAIAFRK